MCCRGEAEICLFLITGQQTSPHLIILPSTQAQRLIDSSELSWNFISSTTSSSGQIPLTQILSWGFFLITYGGDSEGSAGCSISSLMSSSRLGQSFKPCINSTAYHKKKHTFPPPLILCLCLFSNFIRSLIVLGNCQQVTCSSQRATLLPSLFNCQVQLQCTLWNVTKIKM